MTCLEPACGPEAVGGMHSQPQKRRFANLPTMTPAPKAAANFCGQITQWSGWQRGGTRVSEGSFRLSARLRTRKFLDAVRNLLSTALCLRLTGCVQSAQESRIQRST